MHGDHMGQMMAGAEFDLMFIDMMIPHHEGAIAMAKVAIERAEHKEVRALAEDIIANQGKEIGQLRAWREAWYPDAPDMPMWDMMDMDQLMDMGTMMGGIDMMEMMSMDPAAATQALCSASEPFDLAFIDAMIPHHEGAVMMAEAALLHAIHPEIVGLAQAIIDAQHAEIERMEHWRADWYGASPAATPGGSPAAIDVAVTLGEFSVTSTRSEFVAGQTYRFTVTNDGALPHEFMIVPAVPGIGELDMGHLHEIALVVISEIDLTPGATEVAVATFPEAGTFEVVCALAGHYDAGMTLTVSATG
jgi:uncharacterized protein (DUF305 family)/uncharacterized cupredoxin-like copper-binding protein